MRRLNIISLFLALMILTSFMPNPAISAKILFQPGGTTIVVGRGGEFIVRFWLKWDLVGEPGYFSLGVTWDSPGENGAPSENFTFMSAEAYFDLDGDNLPDNAEAYISVGLTFSEGVVAGNRRYTIVVDHSEGNPRDGEFNVDLKFRAAGADGTPHAAMENHPISIVGTIDVVEGREFLSYSPPNPIISVKVVQVFTVRGVEVSVSPSHQSGVSGMTLNYLVTVANIGSVDDNYALSAIDDAGWNLALSPDSLWIPAGGNKPVKLSVSIPFGAGYSTVNNIRIVASSRTDDTVGTSANCVARVAAKRVEMSISPIHQSGEPGASLTYDVIVLNSGDVSDDYVLTAIDNLGWKLTLSESLLFIPAGENRMVTLSVAIPSDATHSMKDNISVVAASQADNAVNASASCEAHATTVRRSIEISSTPIHRSGAPGDTLGYTVLIKNVGSVDDTYTLSITNVRGWPMRIEPTSLTIASGEIGIATLQLTIPSDALEGDANVAVVTATSQVDPTISADFTCEATVELAQPFPLAAILALLATAAIAAAYALHAIRKYRSRRVEKRPSILKRFAYLLSFRPI